MSEETKIEAEIDEIKKEADEILEDVEDIKADTEDIKADTEEIKEDIQELKEKVSEKKEEDFKERYFYLAAEMENMRKRFEREKEQLRKYGTEKILKGLVDVVDNFERALDAIKNDEDEKVKNIYTGVSMVRDEFVSTLTSNGLEVVKSVGKIFDPNFHEAITKQAAEGKEDQEIIMEYQKGYILNGRLLRAAKVIVASND